jgi:hypothetical protein
MRFSTTGFFHESTPYIGPSLTLSLWADQPTDFRVQKTQNSLKFQKCEKNINPSFMAYKHLLLQQIHQKVPF